MKKLVLILFILTLVGTVTASHNTKTIWSPSTDGCTEEVVADDMVADPSFDSESSCESFVAGCGAFFTPKSQFCGPIVEDMSFLDRIHYTIQTVFS